MPTIFCHNLETNEKGEVVSTRIRMENQKAEAVNSFKQLGFNTVAVGDSYNDVNMLKEADSAYFFNASPEVAKKYPQFQMLDNYEELEKEIRQRI